MTNFQPKKLIHSGSWRTRLLCCCLTLFLWLFLGFGGAATTALAGLYDDRFDGNIFALYAGNGSLIPPRVSLADSLKSTDRATLLFLYVEDSQDCKQYASTISRLQEFYGRAADFVPINADAIPVRANYQPNEPGYYNNGLVPRTVVFDQAGKVVLNTVGQTNFEVIDDVLRQVFDLLPRSESVVLKRRAINEVNVELTR